MSCIPRIALLQLFALCAAPLAQASGYEKELCEIATTLHDDSHWLHVESSVYGHDTLTLNAIVGTEVRKIRTWSFSYDGRERVLKLTRSDTLSMNGLEKISDAIEGAALQRIIGLHPKAKYVRVEMHTGQYFDRFLKRFEKSLKVHGAEGSTTREQDLVLLDLLDRSLNAGQNQLDQDPELIEFSMHWSDLIHELQKNKPEVWDELITPLVTARAEQRARFGTSSQGQFTVMKNSISMEFRVISQTPVLLQVPYLNFTMIRKQ